MKRLLALAAACLLCLGLLGCSPDDEAALTVNGDEVLTVGELEDLLDEVGADEEFLVAYDGRGSGTGTVDSGLVVTLLNFEVLSALLAEELAAEGIEVTEADRTQGEEIVAQLLSSGDPQTGVAPIDPAEAPPTFVADLERLYSRFLALSAASSDDPAEGQAVAQQRIGELLAEADVEIADRYGSWQQGDLENGEVGQVVAPEGPVSATTTTPLAATG